MVTLSPIYRRLYRNQPNVAWRAKADLVSYWRLNEASGDLLDSVGKNNLTDTNTVTTGVGPGGNLRRARQFTVASSEHGLIADNASLSMGTGVRMAMCCWVNFDAINTFMTLMGKFDAVNQCEYILQMNNGTSKIEFVADANGALAGAVTVASTNVISATVWIFISCWYDGVNLSLSINNETPSVSAYTTDIFDGTANFGIGAAEIATPANFLGGRLAGACLWKSSTRPLVGVGMADVRRWLFNSGPAGARGWPFHGGVG